jgi:hypothetical protein
MQCRENNSELFLVGYVKTQVGFIEADAAVAFRQFVLGTVKPVRKREKTEMDVTINNKVQQWVNSTSTIAEKALTTKCTEAHNDDLSTWRDVGKGVYDFMVPGATDYRIVAVKSGTDFDVKAVYKHAKGGGKEKVAGETVLGYD